MTTPAPKNHIVGTGTSGDNQLVGLRRTSVVALSISTYVKDVGLETQSEQFAVYALAGGMWAHVAEFDSLEDANQYITDDPDSYLQKVT